MGQRGVMCGGMDTVFDVSWLEGYAYLMIIMMSHSLKGS